MLRFWKKNSATQLFTPDRSQVSTNVLTEDKDQIPCLPDDLLMMIFDNLTTEERDAINMTCKRFRELDFELGNKSYDDIFVIWHPEYPSIFGSVNEYKFANGRRFPSHPTLHDLRLFRRAKAHALNMIKKCDTTDFEALSKLLETVTFKEFSMHCKALQDCDYDFIPKLTRGMKDVSVRLNWHNSIPHNVNQVRNLLMTLPPMNEFRLTFNKSHLFSNNVTRLLVETSKFIRKFAHIYRDEIISDDATLLHITTQTNRAIIFGNGAYTAQGILKVCELVRQSQLRTKYLKFYARKGACDEILSMTDLEFGRDDERLHPSLIDRATRTIIIFGPKNKLYYTITVAKVDEDGNVIQLKKMMRA